MNNNSPLVSIGMPVYNCEKYISESIQSVLSQTFKNFELIISDNASSDRTEEICREFASQDSRIRYYQNDHNIGLGPNHNRAFELARGKYFKWFHGDDLLAPEYLEKCVSVLESDPSIILCYTREIEIDEEGKPFGSETYLVNFPETQPHKRFKNYIDLWQRYGHIYGNPVLSVIRTEILKMTPLMRTNPWSELAYVGELLLLGRFHEIPEGLFFYRHHSQTSRAIKKTAGWQAAATMWLSGSRKKICRPELGLLFQLLNSIRRSPLNTYEKGFCYLQMARWATWKWKRLLKELVVGAG